MSFFSRVYRGNTDFNFPKFYRRVLIVSGVLIAISIVSFFTRGLNLSIDFRGGTVWEIPSKTMTTADANKILADRNLDNGAKVQKVVDADGQRIIRVQADVAKLSESSEISAEFAKAANLDVKKIGSNVVGPSWGEAITNQAIKALVVFLILVSIYIAIQLEWEMAVGALVALVHDIIITVGVYSVAGFEVTPATVVSFLTILGFSLYDTIVVYDRVLENDARLSRTGAYTFETIMRRSLNQVLMRSVNTTMMAILPVVSMLIVGAVIFGEATLEDFSIALLVGLISGVFSSIAIASPVLVYLKEREPKYMKIRERIAAKGGDPDDTTWHDPRALRPTMAFAGATAVPGGQSSGRPADNAIAAAQYDRPHPPRPRKNKRR